MWKQDRPRTGTQLMIGPGLANGNTAVPWYRGAPRKEGQKSPHTSWHNPHSYLKPHCLYPVFLFLFKFFFKFPNFPFEALDVLGELSNCLWLLTIPTAAPWRTSGPAMVTGRERIIKNHGLPVNTAPWITREVQGMVHYLMNLWW